MQVTRRKFLELSAWAAALLSSPQSLVSCTMPRKTLKEFGLQLYSLKDVMPGDPKGTLKKVAEMGYTLVESYKGDQGIFWGMTNLEFKSLMDELGMKIVSSHVDIRNDFEKTAAEAAEIDMSYLIDPWEGPQKSIDDFKRLADLFNEKGKVCKQNGLRFAYHNHAYSFQELEGQIPQDVLMQNTDPALVDFEMDIYWVVTAGHNPEEWLQKYPNRWRLCHIKDREKDAAAENSDASCVLGTGAINFEQIFKTALKEGMEYYIVEQERFANISSLEAAKQNAAYLKELKF